VSVGHLARLLEAAGIATAVIAVAAFRPRLVAMTLPRLVITPHLMGRPIGMPGDRAGQREVVCAALDLLERAEAGGTIVNLPGHYRPVP
jgi:hypothetical protein